MNDGAPWLRTARLDLRPAGASDCSCVLPLWTAPEVRRFLFDERAISADEARGFLEASEASFAAHGFGLWLALERDAAGLAGFAGLLPSGGEAPNLLFGVDPRRWRRNLATEAASAVLRHAFETLGIPRVDADVDEPNAASIRVLEKVGMSRTRSAVVNGRPLLYFARTAGPVRL